ISATNHNLAKLVEEKKFRQDLYFRIKGVSVTLPPLRHRREDIEELFGYFLKEACEELSRDIHRITEPAMNILMGYSWPGNVRQLRHTVRTMVVLCEGDTLDVEDIPPDVHHVKRLSGYIEPTGAASGSGSMSGLSLEEVERRHIADTLRMVDNNRAEAARILKIGERTLYRKIKEYGL
ncbi:MAG TPA: sigma-54-dependent Fis family transcriptional regulator, partial [Phycisphaerales bacterium]|nr:sigma-54-dependent Fis family transcriptional regulator [Phycisphaerales bacterium]